MYISGTKIIVGTIVAGTEDRGHRGERMDKHSEHQGHSAVAFSWLDVLFPPIILALRIKRALTVATTLDNRDTGKSPSRRYIELFRGQRAANIST